LVNLRDNVDIYCEPGVVFTGFPNIRDNGVTVNSNIYGSLKIYTTSSTTPPFNITAPSIVTFEFDWISSYAASIQIIPASSGGRITIKGNYIYSATIGQAFGITVRNAANVVINITHSIEAPHSVFAIRFFTGNLVVNCPNINLMSGNAYGGNFKHAIIVYDGSSTGNIIINGDINDRDTIYYSGIAAMVRLWASPSINLTINGDIKTTINPALALGTGGSSVTYTGEIITTREAIYTDASTRLNVKNSTIVRTTDTFAGPITVSGSSTLYINDSTIYSGFTGGNIINIESNNAKLYIKGVTSEGIGSGYFVNIGTATPTTGLINTYSTNQNHPSFTNAYTSAGSFIQDSAINTPKF
jgi:hypothetical protein